MRISVVLALPGRQHVVALDLPEGATVQAAIDAAGLRGREPDVDVGALASGVWGRGCERSAVLREGDRVELYRPIEADARAMRRERARLKR